MLRRNREVMAEGTGAELSLCCYRMWDVYLSEIKEGDSGRLHGRRAPKPKRRRERGRPGRLLWRTAALCCPRRERAPHGDGPES